MERKNMPSAVEMLERKLNDFNPRVRREALEELAALARSDAAFFSPVRPVVNLHCHSFFSYNGYGYSPSFLAWRARREGMMMAGVVDFDVLDATDEFLDACHLLGLKGCAGFETRVFLPEFASREINSPGEPGISYHMGIGFTTSTPEDRDLLDAMRAAAGARTRDIVSRVNAFLAPVVLDYERDVLPLTPGGNATERHVCQAYEQKAESIFPDIEDRAAFWASKLGGERAAMKACMADSAGFQGLVRSKTMKSGGVGYVKPDGSSFPRLAAVNAFTLAAGAIPAMTWLDGLSEGEQAIEELIDLQISMGAAALNIIPDRNWNLKDSELKKRKVAELHRIVEVSRRRHLPIIVGTEMNAPGQRFVDDFDAPELAPLAPAFLEGAWILHAHTVLQRLAGMGYVSAWAEDHLPDRAARNAFFSGLGECLPAGLVRHDTPLSAASSPEDVCTALLG